MRGFAVWSIMQWWNTDASKICDNPWIDPWTTWGNGQLAFFYTPSPLGVDLPAKDMSITPSLRLVLTRDGIEDYEYATILEELIKKAESKDVNTANAVKAMNMMRRPLHTPTSWGLSEAYWEKARTAMAEAIEDLSTPKITKIEVESSGDTVSISWTVLPDRNYQLYYSNNLGAGEQWLPIPGSYPVNDGIATQTFTVSGGINKRFFKVKIQ